MLIFLFITLFSVGGAFTNISYTYIFGKSVNENKRKTFFSAKQVIAGIVILISAFIAKKVMTLAEHPVNFANMFFIGASLLLIASGGFWKLQESIPSTLKIKGLKDYFKTLKSELAKNRKLIYFLGFINTQGVIVSFLPFVVLYAKEIFNTQSSDTGNFLLFKIIGIVIVSLVVFFVTGRIKYNLLLYFNVALSVTMIILNIKEDPEVFENYLRHPRREPSYRAGRRHYEFVTSLEKAGYNITPEELIPILTRNIVDNIIRLPA